MTINVFGGGSSGGPVFPVQRSVRLRASNSAYFNRTLSAGNQQKFTFSCWIKRGLLSTDLRQIFGVGTTGSSYCQLRFNTNDTLYLASENGGAVMSFTTTQVFRDPSAWYHIILAIDTTQATDSNRVKFYVNGSQITSFSTSTYPTQNTNLLYNSNAAHYIGTTSYATTSYLQDGYLTEVNFIDGQALTPTSFGSYNSTTGVWQPVKYTGTYGTNGFYLNFQDNSNNTAATIGKDSSGNGNNWTPNGISVTAGATYDSMLDVPTLTGAENANFAVLNAIDKTMIVSAGNLNAAQNAAAYVGARATFGITSGKWYWEMVVTSAPSIQSHGLATSAWGLSSAFTAGSWFYHMDGTKYLQGVNTAYGASYTTGDVLGFAFDADAGTITCYKNSVTQGVLASGLTSGPYFTALTMYGTGNVNYNFGQRPFSYTPPTGFKSLNTYNLPDSTIPNGAEQFAATTYTGNGTSQTISNGTNNTLGKTFQPGLVWGKNRSTATSNVLVDSVRGATIFLQSNSTAAEATNAQVVSAFTSTGFSLGNDATLNGSTNLEVAWQWKGGGAAVTNTSGSISSQVSANLSAGFSIVTYTGTGANATVGHGLNIVPSMIIVKNRDNASIGGAVYHTSLGATKYLQLFQTTTGNVAATTDNTAWNGGSPTFNGSVFSIGSLNRTNSAQQMVAYCFSEIAGFSKFGSYTGNGVIDGPFVYLGFKPRFIMIKYNGVDNWAIFDTARLGYNVDNNELQANAASMEGTGDFIDILSNGFKNRNSDARCNASGGTYIYAAFAENPFKNALAR
jgi:hypothetical protein